MSRVTVIDPRTADGAVRTLLDAVQSQLGVVPNFVRVLANSGAALSGFLGLYAGVGESRIDAATRERIALAIAEGNACRYCVSAHTAVGRKTGLTNDEMQLNRRGRSADAKAAAAVAFAVALNQHMGEVTADEVEAVRRAGFDDGEIVEIVAVVVLNIFTNMIGKATQVEIDFPQVALLRPSAAVAA